MHYLKSLFFNFLVVFFANHILPGIDVMNQTKLPHVGGDLSFAIVLGGINSLIFPVLKLVGKASTMKIAGLALAINFIAYALLKILPIGIRIETIEGYCFAAVLVAFGSFLTNYCAMKHAKVPPPACGEGQSCQKSGPVSGPPGSGF